MCFFSLVPVQIICKNPLYVVFTAILLNSSRMLPSYSFQRVECSKHRNRNRNVEIKSSYYLCYSTYISRIQVMLALNQQTTLSGNNHSTLTHQTYVPFSPLLLILTANPLKVQLCSSNPQKEKKRSQSYKSFSNVTQQAFDAAQPATFLKYGIQQQCFQIL